MDHSQLPLDAQYRIAAAELDADISFKTSQAEGNRLATYACSNGFPSDEHSLNLARETFSEGRNEAAAGLFRAIAGEYIKTLQPTSNEFDEKIDEIADFVVKRFRPTYDLMELCKKAAKAGALRYRAAALDSLTSTAPGERWRLPDGIHDTECYNKQSVLQEPAGPNSEAGAASGTLLNLPEWLHGTQDPIDANPFPVDDLRHDVWEKATREADEEALRLNSERLAAPDRGIEWIVLLVAGKFDIWAKRGVQVVWSDRAVGSFDHWLVNYGEAWFQSIQKVVPPGGPRTEVLRQVRAKLTERIEWWKSEARRYLREQKADRSRVAEPRDPPDDSESPQCGGPKLNIDLIERWITEEGHDNKTLAEALGVSVRTVSSIRNNGDSHGGKAVTKLANLMKRDVEDLYLA